MSDRSLASVMQGALNTFLGKKQAAVQTSDVVDAPSVIVPPTVTHPVYLTGFKPADNVQALIQFPGEGERKYLTGFKNAPPTARDYFDKHCNKNDIESKFIEAPCMEFYPGRTEGWEPEELAPYKDPVEYGRDFGML